MSHPICASNCLSLLTAEDPCNLQVKCLCTSTNYLAGYRDCLYLYCDAADIKSWVAYSESQCALVGIYFSTSGVTATQAPGALSTSVSYQTSVLTAVAGPASTLASSASTVGAQPVTSNTPASAPTTMDSKGGLGVGAIVGIAIGATALVVIAILVAFLIWRQRRKRSRGVPPESTEVREVKVNDSQTPDVEKEVKSMTTTSVVYTPELSSEQAIYAANYEKKSLVPGVTSDPRYPTQQLNPPQPDSVYHLSPSSANTELAAVVPSEVTTSTRAAPEYELAYHGVVEADSAHQSRITSPVSELGNMPYEMQNELSASPYMTSHSPRMEHPMLAPQELFSHPPATLPATHASASVAGVSFGTGDTDDTELNRMKTEIEAVRAEKERVLHLQALEERERELSRRIVNRELSKGVGSGFTEER